MTGTQRDLRDGLAVVTGAGAGLGRALSVELTRRGIPVAGIGRHTADLEETGRLSAPGLFTAFVADVADFAEVGRVFRELADGGRPLSILFNNAAIYEREDFLKATPDSIMRSVNVNLGGVICCTSEALGRMAEQGYGRIINVATFADLGPLSGSLAYSVSKGAARIFTRALVADIGDRLPGIVVNDWVPGALATRMGISDGIDPATSARWGVNLALIHDPEINGATFDRDTEAIQPRSKKRILKDLLLFRKAPVARRL